MAPPLPDVVKYSFVPSWLTEELVMLAGVVPENTEANVAPDFAVPPEPDDIELPLVDRYIPPVPTARTILPFALQLTYENTRLEHLCQYSEAPVLAEE